jgi:hypothetical protein
MIYGHDRTIHQTGEVNVEIGPDGKVVAVWFRCAMLPFTQHIVDQERAEDMHAANSRPLKPIQAIDFKDLEEDDPPLTLDLD